MADHSVSPDEMVAPVSDGERLRRVAREDFGWEHLRPGQLEAMTALLAGRDVLVGMPTGSGKSAIYQVTAALADSITVVVSPLIALQRDQVAGIVGADDAPIPVAVNSALGAVRTARAWDDIVHHGAECVFLAPEQLTKDDVLERLRCIGVSLLVVDEAHCACSWGLDFRPDYLRLGAVRDRLGHPPILALTATASPPVRRAIIDLLRLDDPVVVMRGFDRSNIRLEVTRCVRSADKRRALLGRVSALDTPGLVYVATRKDTLRYSAWLTDRGMRAVAYHGGMRAAERSTIHDGFRGDRYDVVVATSAFGLGIDKPGVRFVVHEAISQSLDEYYQEIGRAGRDGAPATAVLFYRPEDLALRQLFAVHRAHPDLLRKVYCALGSTPASARRLRAVLNLRNRTLISALNLLERAGAVGSAGTGFTATSTSAEAAVEAALHVAEVAERLDRSRTEMMRAYAETPHCRRQFLLGYLGEQLEVPCGNCDRCDSPSAMWSAGDPAFPLGGAVRHAVWGDGTIMRVDTDRITVLFDEYGYHTLSLDALDRSGVLQQLGLRDTHVPADS